VQKARKSISWAGAAVWEPLDDGFPSREVVRAMLCAMSDCHKSRQRVWNFFAIWPDLARLH